MRCRPTQFERPNSFAGLGDGAGRAIEPGPRHPSTLQPAWEDGTTALFTGDATDVLAELPAESVDCVVTSPPYWGLRDYGTGTWVGGEPGCAHVVGCGSHLARTMDAHATCPASTAHRDADAATCARCGAVRRDRQLGVEPTPEDYIDSLLRVFAAVWRVLAPTGTAWLNLGDSYSAAPPTKRARPSTNVRVLPRKNLLGLPWRVAIALQGDGWILRNAVVWAKRNPMPESVRDRLAATYEFVFLLVKQPRYYFDLDAIRVPLARPEALDEDIQIGGTTTQGALVGSSRRRRGHSAYGRSGKYRAPSGFPRGAPGAAMRPTSCRHDTTDHGDPVRGKNPGDVWRYSTRPLRAAHFAAFPIDIPLRCIAAGCPDGGVVLDPFSGAGTTGMAATQFGRRYIGIDLNSEYHAIARDRITQHAQRTRRTRRADQTRRAPRSAATPDDRPCASGGNASAATGTAGTWQVP